MPEHVRSGRDGELDGGAEFVRAVQRAIADVRRQVGDDPPATGGEPKDGIGQIPARETVGRTVVRVRARLHERDGRRGGRGGGLQAAITQLATMTMASVGTGQIAIPLPRIARLPTT